MARRREGAAAATVNRETSALCRMFRLAFELGWILQPSRSFQRGYARMVRDKAFSSTPITSRSDRISQPRTRTSLDFAYYSRMAQAHEILGLRWQEVDAAANVSRLPPQRSKTRTGRVLPISKPLGAVLARRRARRKGDDPLVFRRDPRHSPGLAAGVARSLCRRRCARPTPSMIAAGRRHETSFVRGYRREWP